MAGEQKGKAYEALTKVALERIVTSKSLKGEIFWDQRPDGMTIVPDLTIGKDKDHPTVALLVTHSGAAGNSHMKFWRNMGELVEAKVCLPTIPRVFNLAFDSIIKESLKKSQAASYDGLLFVGDLDYGAELQQWIDDHLNEFPRDKHEKVGFIKTRARRDAVLKRLLARFTNDLNKLLLKKAPVTLDEIWRLERQRSTKPPPVARKTSIKRGLGKLLVVPEAVTADLIAGKSTIRFESELQPAIELGILRKTIAGVRVADDEVVQALTLLSPVSLTALLVGRSFPQGLTRVIDQVRLIGQIEPMVSAVVGNYSSLVTPEGMFKALEQIHADPTFLLDKAELTQLPTDVWLFRVVCDLVKATGKRKQGYGYAQLVQDIKKAAKSGDLLKCIKSLCGPAATLPIGGTEPIRRGLQDYVNRISGTSFSKSQVAVVAFVLAGRLRELSVRQLQSALPELRATWISSTFEARLLTHRVFDPLGDLIRAVLKGLKVREIYMQSCFAMTGGSSGSELAATTKVLIVKETLINAQSCSDAGRDHKKKELCGRAVALRYSWDASKKRFVPRPGLKKLILLVDGTWRQGDLDALARAGWDEIFYPDQMDELKKAIV